jgi:Sulfotransferase family
VSATTRVVYVMGAGHSGSTILGVALGNCAGFFYAGEVDEWLLKGSGRWAGEERTRFWEAVRVELGDAAESLQGEAVNRLLERSSAIFRLGVGAQRRSILPRYRAATERLFAAIASVAGASYVIDTSHFPLRARGLQRMEGIELHLLFLVRDPQAVVESNVRELSRHEVAERRVRTLGTNLGLWLTQLLSIYVFLRQPRARRMFLRYEDFAADPAGVVRQLLDHAGSDAAVPDMGALAVGVPLEGNRLLAAQTISIEPPRRASASPSRLTTVLQRPWQAALLLLRPAARAGKAVG